MKTKTINLYNLEELSKEAQKKAHNKWIENNEYYFLEESMTEYVKEELLKKHNLTAEDITVRYSLSCCQGDGAMVEGDFGFEYEGLAYVAVVKHSGHYYHERSTSIEIFKLDIDNDRGDIPDSVSYADLDKYFEYTLYIPMCKELAKFGYEFIEGEDSFESFKDSCEANGYTFLENGTMENE